MIRIAMNDGRKYKFAETALRNSFLAKNAKRHGHALGGGKNGLNDFLRICAKEAEGPFSRQSMHHRVRQAYEKPDAFFGYTYSALQTSPLLNEFISLTLQKIADKHSCQNTVKIMEVAVGHGQRWEGGKVRFPEQPIQLILSDIAPRSFSGDVPPQVELQQVVEDLTDLQGVPGEERIDLCIATYALDSIFGDADVWYRGTPGGEILEVKSRTVAADFELEIAHSYLSIDLMTSPAVNCPVADDFTAGCCNDIFLSGSTITFVEDVFHKKMKASGVLIMADVGYLTAASSKMVVQPGKFPFHRDYFPWVERELTARGFVVDLFPFSDLQDRAPVAAPVVYNDHVVMVVSLPQ